MEQYSKLAPSLITRVIVADPKIECTQKQSSHLIDFGTHISNWFQADSTKKNYLQHYWQKNEMSKSHLLEILEILPNSPESIPDTDNYFVNSPLFVDMLSEIRVLAHDFGNSRACNFILFMAKYAKKKIELAAKIYEKEPGDKKGAVQFSCDFTHITGGKFQLGMVLVEDANHKGWPTSYILCPTENAHFARDDHESDCKIDQYRFQCTT